MIRGNEYQGLLKIGQSVRSMLYGGRNGIVVSIQGEQSPSTIERLGRGCIVRGGTAQFVIVFEDGVQSVVPEAIVRGVQWYISDKVATEAQIEVALVHAEWVRVEKAQAKVLEAQRKRREIDSLPARYPYLKPLTATPGKNSWTAGAANVRRHLKREFPGVKFSVKSKAFANGTAIDVKWVDGPSRKEVEAITNPYQYGHFNGMVDCYYHNHEVFPDVFGSAKFVSCQRNVSDAAFAVVAREMGWPEVQRDGQGEFEGCDYDTGMMIQRMTWARSFTLEEVQ